MYINKYLLYCIINNNITCIINNYWITIECSEYILIWFLCLVVITYHNILRLLYFWCLVMITLIDDWLDLYHTQRETNLPFFSPSHCSYILISLTVVDTYLRLGYWKKKRKYTLVRVTLSCQPILLLIDIRMELGWTNWWTEGYARAEYFFYIIIKHAFFDYIYSPVHNNMSSLMLLN